MKVRKEHKNRTGKGKQTKHFLEKNDAVDLATSIVGIQEEKAKSKVEKHSIVQSGPSKQETGQRTSSGKTKLKETKALLAAKLARLKKDKAKKRKRRSQSDLPNNAHEPDALDKKPVKAARKSVSFA